MAYHFRRVVSLLLILLLFSITCFTSLAADSESDPVDPNQLFYMGSPVNAGKDTGFTGNNTITNDDPHYGWELGRFFVSGYTRINNDNPDNPVILKNVGDKVTLWFTLSQDINALNGSDTLTISDDVNGYDEYFGLQKTDMGRGALIVRHTDYQNAKGDPQIYTDYLSAIDIGANTKVELCEEGDYEVALDYEVQRTRLNYDKVLFWDTHIRTLPAVTNYRIYFKFSVRNGNCMVFAFDSATGDELANGSVTNNGFRLDLANSHYLLVDIRKEILNVANDELIEDTRFNRPAKDGETYEDEGIYTITVQNPYTQRQTEKRIYVGSNQILKASVVTGLPISEIQTLVANGAQINENGTMSAPFAIPANESPEVSETEFVPLPESDATPSPESSNNSNTTERLALHSVLLICVGIAAVIIIVFVLSKITKAKK